MEPIPAALVVAASITLSVVAALAIGSRPHEPALAAVPAPAADAARFAALEARIAALAKRPAPLRADLPSGDSMSAPMPERGPVEPAGDGARIADLARRIEQLEQRLAGPPPARRRSPQEEARLQAERAAEIEAAITTAKNAIMDPRTSVQAKVEAHRLLRHVEDAYSPAMVQELLRLARLDPEPTVRAATWTSFDGTTRLPELVRPLLNALANDPDAAPRNEASETLGNYADHPGVLEALRHAAGHDPSLEVRTKALRTLREVDPEYR